MSLKLWYSQAQLGRFKIWNRVFLFFNRLKCNLPSFQNSPFRKALPSVFLLNAYGLFMRSLFYPSWSVAYTRQRIDFHCSWFMWCYALLEASETRNAGPVPGGISNTLKAAGLSLCDLKVHASRLDRNML